MGSAFAWVCTFAKRVDASLIALFSADVVVRFVVGSQGLTDETRRVLAEEHTRNGDMVVIDSLLDAYAHLTDKLAASLTWSVHHFDFQYLLKVMLSCIIRLSFSTRLVFDRPTMTPSFVLTK